MHFSTPYASPPLDYIDAYTRQGTRLFNLSFSSISPAITSVRYINVALGAVYVLEDNRNRLTWFSIHDGALLGSVTLPNDVQILGLAADRAGLFVSRLIQSPTGTGDSSSVVRFNHSGSLTEEYVVGPLQGGNVLTYLVVDDTGDRLYGTMRYTRTSRCGASDEADRMLLWTLSIRTSWRRCR